MRKIIHKLGDIKIYAEVTRGENTLIVSSSNSENRILMLKNELRVLTPSEILEMIKKG